MKWLWPYAAFFLGPVSFALPDPRLANQIPLEIRDFVSKHPSLDGANLFMDGDLAKKIIYVSPANRTVRSGPIRINASDTRCGELEGLYRAAYRVPPAQTAIRIAKEGSFSAFFDLHYGNSVRHQALFSKLLEALEKFTPVQPGIRTELDTAKKEQQYRLSELEVAKKKLQELSSLKISEIEPEILVAQEEVAKAKEKEEHAFQNLKAIRQRAPKNLSSLEPSSAEQRVQSIAKDLEIVQTVTEAHFNRVANELLSYQATTLGTAPAQIKLWGDEVELVRAQAPNFKIEPLPIKNVRMDFEANTLDQQAGDASDTSMAEGNTAAKAYSVLSNWANNGDAVRLPVTRGSFCMNSAGSGKPTKFSAPAISGKAVFFTGYRFESPPPAAQTYQQAGLTYEYFIQAEPVKVNCSLDWHLFVAKFPNRISDDFWFQQKPWNSDMRKEISETGIECRIVDRPREDNVDSAEKLNEIVQTFTQEMIAEAIIERSKYFEIWTSKFKFMGLGGKDQTRRLFGARASLCSNAFHCLFPLINWNNPLAEAEISREGENEHRYIKREFSATGHLIQMGTAFRKILLDF